MNAVLIQQIYPDTEGVKLLEMNVTRNREYCRMHNFDYWYRFENCLPGSDPLKGSWSKVELMRQALAAGYRYVIWLDADTLIYDFNTDLRLGVVPEHIGACWHRIPQLHHWNVGALYLSNTGRVRDFIGDWLAAYPGANDGWMEQGVFNRLAMQSDIVQTISDRWNSTIHYTEVPDAVVLGYHGAGTTKERADLMQTVLHQLPTQKAETDSGLSGVNSST
jgi:hypothetical protein